MMNAQELVDLIGVDKSTEILGTTLLKYLEDNMDLYEKFIDGVFANVSNSPNAIDQITNAVVGNLIGRIERGDFDSIGNEVLEGTVKEIFTKISARLS